MPDFHQSGAITTLHRLGGPGVEDSDPFVFGGGVWPNRNLRWFLRTGTPDLTDEAATLQRAFDTWAARVPLTFTRVFTAAQADLTVSWELGDHGDGDPFEPAGKRFREWVSIPTVDRTLWQSLLTEAVDFARKGLATSSAQLPPT